MTTELTIPGDLTGARLIRDAIEQAIEASGCTQHDAFALKLCSEEALINAIKDGNQMDPDKWVRVVCYAAAGRLDVRITDEGSGFTRIVRWPSQSG